MADSAPAAYVDVDTGHEYDGIRELDNRLPNWWLMTLWGAVAFGIGYWVWFEAIGAAPTQREELAMEHAAAQAEEAKREAVLAASGEDPNSEAALAALTADPAAVADGKDAFATYCAACHRMDGGGLIGPNLVDDVAIHGGTAVDVYRVIAEGVLAKGMPAWKPVLGPGRTRAATAYVLTLRGTKVDNPKAPQGTPIDKPSQAPGDDVKPSDGTPGQPTGPSSPEAPASGALAAPPDPTSTTAAR